MDLEPEGPPRFLDCESRVNQENLEHNREIRVQRREVRKNRETACNPAKTMSAAWE